MPLIEFSCQDFRCIASAEISLHSGFTLVHGANASGKTSLLEAIAVLGRGRSFRGAGVRDLVRHGTERFLLRGGVERDGRRHRLALQNGREGLEQRVDGDAAGGLSALARALPLQVIDPEVHELVGGGPEHRRRFMDWMAFHVEHGFLETWRRFRRALKQRNAALKAGAALESWDAEFLRAGEALDAARGALLEKALPRLAAAAEALLEAPVSFEYQRGWPVDENLETVLSRGRERDRSAGSTQAGPQRADLRQRVDERLARRLVSRGQQKLLACAMVIGSVQVAAEALGQPPLLLLDDPAAELDKPALGRLLTAVDGLRNQVVATALTADAVPLPAEHALFHVERGRFSPG